MVQHDDLNTVEWQTDSTEAVVLRYREIDNERALEGQAPGSNDWTTISRYAKKTPRFDDFELRGPASDPRTRVRAISAPASDIRRRHQETERSDLARD